ncbi:MAG: wax ester/triacylglycerol synthase family O-acyltransferase [Acidimicrobiales bacterium]
MAEQLAGIDAAFLSMESPTSHLQGIGVVRLDAAAPRLDVEELRALVRHRLPHLDLLHRRLVEVPGGLDQPYWIDVVPDLDEHVRAGRLPEGAAPADLEAFVAEVAATPCDRTRPMWEFWLVDDLPGGGQALIIKMHHALSDGVGALALVAQLFDTEAGPIEASEEEPGSVQDEEPPSTPWLLGQAALHFLRRPVELVTTTAELVATAGRLRASVTAQAGLELAAPLVTPHLPFHGPVTADRSVALRDLPLDRVKAIARASDTRVNDVVLTLLAGTLRRWLLLHDELPDQPLVAAVPVSTRTEADLFDPGNHVSVLFVHLLTNVADPRERLELTAAVATGGKTVHTAFGPHTLTRMASITYPLVLSVPMGVYQRTQLAERHPAAVNLVVSNVPGPPFDLFLAGRRAAAFYALGPIFDGVALNITVISFHGVLGFGYITCPDRLDDLHRLADQQDAALEELASAVGV